MYPNQPHNQMGGSPLTSSISACATVASGAASFFGTPPAYSHTVQSVLNFSAKHYAITSTSDLANLLAITWWLLVLIIIFVVANFFFKALFLAFASRFFNRWL